MKGIGEGDPSKAYTVIANELRPFGRAGVLHQINRADGPVRAALLDTDRQWRNANSPLRVSRIGRHQGHR
jgi:hypothetical protein